MAHLTTRYADILDRATLPSPVLAVIRQEWEADKAYTKESSLESPIAKVVTSVLVAVLTFGMPIALLLAAYGVQGFGAFANLSMALTWIMIILLCLGYGLGVAATMVGTLLADESDADKSKVRKVIFNGMSMTIAYPKRKAYGGFLTWFTRIMLPVSLAMYGAVGTAVAYVIVVVLLYMAKALSKRLMEDYAENMIRSS